MYVIMMVIRIYITYVCDRYLDTWCVWKKVCKSILQRFFLLPNSHVYWGLEITIWRAHAVLESLERVISWKLTWNLKIARVPKED